MLYHIVSKGVDFYMLGKVFGIMCLISIVFGAINGSIYQLGNAVFEGAEAAISLTISLSSVICLWNGVMNVLKQAGAIKLFAKLISPILRIFFPDAYAGGKGKEEISASIAANLLGIGNAATPLALSAMKEMHDECIAKGGDGTSPTRDMITLAVLNTASANLLPTTIIALRRMAGSANPFSVVAPIWICSFSSAALALLITRACGMNRKRKNRKIKEKEVVA